MDLGGTAVWWSRATVKPRLTVVSLYEAGEDAPEVTAIDGDAPRPDELLRGEDFDLFSNGLSRTSGGDGPGSRLAEVVVSLAPAYLIQTPYRYFSLSDGRSATRMGGSQMPRRGRSCQRSSCLPRKCADIPARRDRLGAHCGRAQIP